MMHSIDLKEVRVGDFVYQHGVDKRIDYVAQLGDITVLRGFSDGGTAFTLPATDTLLSYERIQLRRRFTEPPGNLGAVVSIEGALWVRCGAPHEWRNENNEVLSTPQIGKKQFTVLTEGIKQ